MGALFLKVVEMFVFQAIVCLLAKAAENCGIVNGRELICQDRLNYEGFCCSTPNQFGATSTQCCHRRLQSTTAISNIFGSNSADQDDQSNNNPKPNSNSASNNRNSGSSDRTNDSDSEESSNTGTYAGSIISFVVLVLVIWGCYRCWRSRSVYVAPAAPATVVATTVVAR